MSKIMPGLKPKEINSEVYTYIEIIFEFYRMVTPIMIFWILKKIVRNEHQHISFLIDECSVLLK